MLLDERTEFLDANSIAAAAGTALAGDVMDLGATAPGLLGHTDALWFIIQTTTEVITAGAAGTVRFQLVSDAQAAIAVDGSATVHLDTGTLVTGNAASNSALLNVGGVILAARLPTGAVYERYLGVLVITATTTTTAGAVNAFLAKDLGQWSAMASVSNV